MNFRSSLKPSLLSTIAALSLALGLAAPQIARAGFPNGGFESDLTNWNVSSYLWKTTAPRIIPTFPPVTEADLGLELQGTSNGLTSAVGTGLDTQSGNNVGYPLYANKSARINYVGNNFRVSSIDQTATMTVADVDPADGKAHVRFAIAPVLQNPGHPTNQQPYFFVEITNVTKGIQLYHTFNFSGQTGVPWVTVGSYQYTNWQAIDIAPGAGVLDVGDQVKVKVIGAGCGQGGHEGHVYVDSGPTLTTLPGPYVYATAPQYASPGGTITYVYTYGNSGTSPLTNTTVTVISPQDNTATPQNLTFQSLSGTGTGVCTTPAVGAAGTITCNFGTYNPNNVGTFQVTFNVPNPAVGPINHGNYKISGDNSPAILGPLVQTNLPGSTPLVDLGVTVTDGQTSVVWGQALSYTVVVNNAGPTAVPVGATIHETLSTGLTGATWTCVAAGGASCPNASGSGAINETTTATLPVGATLTYTVLATATGTGTDTLSNSVTVTAPAGVLDSSSANNTAADIDNVSSALFTLSVSKTGAGSGTVAAVPGGVNCGASCAASYPSGSSVVLYASAPAGSIFAGWSGGGCSGTAPSCTVNMTSNLAVVANFVPPLTVHAVVGANGTVSPNVDQPVAPGGTVSYTVTPSAGYALQVTDNCAAGGAQTGGALVGNTYTTNAIAQDCTVNFAFVTGAGVVYAVTPTVGANGSITPNAVKTVLAGGVATYVVTANSGFAPTTPTGTCAPGSWSGNAYSTGAVNADCTVIFGFAAAVPPTVVADTSTAVAGTAGTFDVAANDTKPVGASYSLTGGTCSGAGVNSAGLATFTAPALIAATCTVNYQVCNPAPDASTCASSILTVTATAPPLSAVADAASSMASIAGSFDVAANDTKPVGATYSLTGGTCAAASVSSSGLASYTAPSSVGSTCTVLYSVCDPVPNALTCSNATLTVTATVTPDMSISLAGLPASATVGVAYSGTFSCTNLGAGTASSGTTCTVSGLPAGVSLGSCTISPSSAAWVAGNAVPAGQTVTCSVSGTPSSAGNATVSGSTGAVGDSTPGNNTATASIAVAAAPDMSISLAGLPASATVGVAYSGTFSCTNLGAGAASSGTTCTVSGLPAGVSLGSCTISPSSAAWVAGNAVPAGQTVTCYVSGVPSATGSAMASGSTSASNDPNPGNNVATQAIVTAAPTSIPTLSEYMMLLLAGLLAWGSLLALRQRAP